MKYIAFAASPNQLISIKEYIYQNNIDNYSLYIFFTKNLKINNEIYSTLKILKLKKIIKITRNNNYILSLIKNILLLINLFFKYKNIKKIFIITDFLNTFYHILRLIFKESKFILVDDGMAIFWIYQKYLTRKIYLPINQRKGFFKNKSKIKNFFFDFDFLKNKKFEVFTMYADELKLKQEHKNKLIYTKNLRKKKYKFNKDLVYIIGTKYFESDILTLDEEIKILKKIDNFWKNKNCIYVAKRTTSIKKILFIKKHLNIPVIYFELPLELAFIYSKKELPLYVCSMGSSLDFTLPALFKRIDYYFINFNSLKKKISLKTIQFILLIFSKCITVKKKL